MTDFGLGDNIADEEDLRRVLQWHGLESTQAGIGCDSPKSVAGSQCSVACDNPPATPGRFFTAAGG